jgi:hypothetical protein
MKENPVLQESVTIFFGEGHGLSPYLYLLAIIAPVQLLSLYLPSLDVQVWSGSASLFKVSGVTALLLTVYLALRVANQEFAGWRFKPIKRWIREAGLSVSSVFHGQVGFLFLHCALAVLICAPFLVWAGAIARTPLPRVGVTFSLLLFYSFCYGVWGLVSLALWERRLESRQVFIRSFFFFLVIFSAVLYLPLNPVVFLLAYLSHQDMAPLNLMGWKMPATAVHLTFHLLLGSAGLVAHRWVLMRG